MSGKTLAGAQVRVSRDATCERGHPSMYRGRRGVVLGATADRKRWRVHMMDDGEVALLTRAMLHILSPHDDEPPAPRPEPSAARSQAASRFDERLAIAQSIRINAASAPRGYSDAWRLQSVRPGADDHEQHPSRIADTRVWRDGRREAVK